MSTDTENQVNQINEDTLNKANEWLRSGSNSLSTVALLREFLGIKHFGSICYPHSPSDFALCYDLIEAIPEVRAAVDSLGSKSEHWKMMAEHWDEFTAIHMKAKGQTSNGMYFYKRIIYARAKGIILVAENANDGTEERKRRYESLLESSLMRPAIVTIFPDSSQSLAPWSLGNLAKGRGIDEVMENLERMKNGALIVVPEGELEYLELLDGDELSLLGEFDIKHPEESSSIKIGLAVTAYPATLNLNGEEIEIENGMSWRRMSAKDIENKIASEAFIEDDFGSRRKRPAR